MPDVCKAMVKRAPQLDWKEVFVEIEWLLEGGMSPLYIVSVLQLNPVNVEQACRRYKKPYATLFDKKKLS
jgi:hypothetical protein